MNKKWLSSLALAAVLVGAGPAAAQDVLLGVKGGLNVSDVKVDEDGTDVPVDTKTGLVAGAFAQIGLGDVFAVRPEALYSSKGGSVSDEGVDADISLDYIEIPVLLVARIPTSGALRPNLFAGPVISFEASCEVSGSADGITVSGDCEEIDEEDPLLTKSTDFGVAFGGGLELDTGGAVLLLDGRYTLGLSDINDIESAPESLKNRAWSFTAGVGFKIG